MCILISRSQSSRSVIQLRMEFVWLKWYRQRVHLVFKWYKLLIRIFSLSFLPHDFVLGEPTKRFVRNSAWDNMMKTSANIIEQKKKMDKMPYTYILDLFLRSSIRGYNESAKWNILQSKVWNYVMKRWKRAYNTSYVHILHFIDIFSHANSWREAVAVCIFFAAMLSHN